MNPTLATFNDLPALHAIAWAAKAHWGYPSTWMELWKDDLTITPLDFAGMNIYCSRHQEQIVGFCGIIRYPTHFEVEHLWVLPTYMGQQRGKQLLLHALVHEVSGDALIRVVADPHAEAFYQKMGFTTVSHIASKLAERYLPIMERTGISKLSAP